MAVKDRARETTSTFDYTHLPLGEDVLSFAGYYTPEKEVRLPFGGREVLYVTGHLVVEATCCGTADFWYAMVPGYVRRWQYRRNEDGLPVTEVEPIADQATRKEIEAIIFQREAVAKVDFC